MYEDIISFASGCCAGPFILDMAGISYCDGSYRIKRRNANLCVFEYILAGEGSVTVNGTQFTARAGDVYILPKGSDHEYAASRHNPWVKIWVNTSGVLPDTLLQSYGLSGIYHVPSCDAQALFERMLHIARQPRESAALFADIALVCHELVQALAQHTHAPLAPPSDLERLRAMLDNSTERKITLADMAAQLCRSPSRTISLFRQAYGVTPYRYLLHKRMQAAQNLLRNTHLPIKEIAYRLQFVDEHYFSTCFGRYAGMPPSAFRRKAR